jgi:hypothetical protein
MFTGFFSFLLGPQDEENMRVIRCHKDTVQAQKLILKKQKSLSRELRLGIKENSSISGCQLIGLDGGVKASSKDAFTMKELEDLINSMPMRKAELRRKSQ